MKRPNIRPDELLKYLEASGKINLSDVETEVMNAKKEESFQKILAEGHQHRIWRGKDGRWRTYIPDQDKGRKLIAKSSRDALRDLILKTYSQEEQDEYTQMTLTELFEEWIKYKAEITESPNTITRHRQHFKKYFAKTQFFQRDIRSIDTMSLNLFCNQLVKEQKLSSRKWQNIKTILKGMFELAEFREWITSNPQGKTRITVKFRQVQKKSGRQETFAPKEQEQLIDYLDRMYEKTGNSAYLAVMVNFWMGLRVGELVALQWKDLDEKRAHIYKEEIRNQASNTYHVADHTKTHTDRYVFLIPKVWKTLSRLPKPSHKNEYIFQNNGRRITSRQIAYVLEKYAERTGERMRSSHKLRKTYASILATKQIPMDEIRQQLGHSDLETTYKYIFNPLTEEETYNRLIEAFEDKREEGEGDGE